MIRVAPYAAAQLSSNDFYKRQLAGTLAGTDGSLTATDPLCTSDENGNISVAGRLVCGALAGMTGTALTHPLVCARRLVP